MGETYRSKLVAQFDDFAEAVSQLPKMRRAPRGSVGTIPSDTLLSADTEGIMVETPTLSSLVPADKAWIFNASVDSKKLVAMCGTLKKLGAQGQAIEIDIYERTLFLAFRTTTLSLPTLWIK